MCGLPEYDNKWVCVSLSRWNIVQTICRWSCSLFLCRPILFRSSGSLVLNGSKCSEMVIVCSCTLFILLFLCFTVSPLVRWWRATKWILVVFGHSGFFTCQRVSHYWLLGLYGGRSSRWSGMRRRVDIDCTPRDAGCRFIGLLSIILHYIAIIFVIQGGVWSR